MKKIVYAHRSAEESVVEIVAFIGDRSGEAYGVAEEGGAD
jgi:hypothetical protein